jgi:hypothetical protein
MLEIIFLNDEAPDFIDVPISGGDGQVIWTNGKIIDFLKLNIDAVQFHLIPSARQTQMQL